MRNFRTIGVRVGFQVAAVVARAVFHLIEIDAFRPIAPRHFLSEFIS